MLVQPCTLKELSTLVEAKKKQSNTENVSLHVHAHHSVETNEKMDANLMIIQFTRSFLVGFGIVSLISGINSENNRYRLQCALSGSACIVTSWFYLKLHRLRRLPIKMAYSFEGNAVAESIRFANWSIAIFLLTSCAFLLRGPFATKTYGPYGLWSWEFDTWCFLAPLLRSIDVITGLPGWHASRMITLSKKQHKYYDVVFWTVCCIIFLVIPSFGVLIAADAMFAPLPDPPVRSNFEIRLGQSLSIFWFVYPLVSLIRTIAIVFGIGSWQTHTKHEMHNDMTHTSSMHLFGKVTNMSKHAYLAFVASPSTEYSEGIQRLHAFASSVPRIDGSNPENTSLLPQNTREYDNIYHHPEVTPLCSQGTDSIVALADIFGQAFAAFGCAYVTLQD